MSSTDDMEKRYSTPEVFARTVRRVALDGGQLIRRLRHLCSAPVLMEKIVAEETCV